MQKGIIAVIIIIVLLGAGTLAWIFMPRSFAPSTQVTQTGSPYGNINNSTTVVPSGASNDPQTVGQGMLGVTGALGGIILVKDFKSDPATEKDKDQKHYYLVGGIDPTATQSPYAISYTESDQSFEIVLLKEPLGDYRKLAEGELMDRLGINAVQACGLRYWVSTPTWVSAKYSTKNLGLSFCPGALLLP